jgi:lipopolysaccharide export system protein LptA
MKSLRPLFLCALLSLVPARGVDVPMNDTIVECAGLFETISTDTEITSTFRDKVVVTGTNLKLTCDFLTVVAIRKAGDAPAALGKYGYFKSLVATGHVRIVQGDREATCARAEIFPGEDKIILNGKVDGALPRVRSLDDQYSAEGERIVLYRGQRRAVIENESTTGPGTRITLPAIKDLGYDKNSPTADEPRKSEQPK